MDFHIQLVKILKVFKNIFGVNWIRFFVSEHKKMEYILKYVLTGHKFFKVRL